MPTFVRRAARGNAESGSEDADANGCARGVEGGAVLVVSESARGDEECEKSGAGNKKRNAIAIGDDNRLAMRMRRMHKSLLEIDANNSRGGKLAWMRDRV
jgi:hypothetical protein